MDPLNRLIGQKLVRVEAGPSGTSFYFESCNLQAYNPVTGPQPLSGLVGASVRLIHYTKDEHLVLAFSRGGTCSISLRASDYVGPEAFCANFEDLSVVE